MELKELGFAEQSKGKKGTVHRANPRDFQVDSLGLTFFFFPPKTLIELTCQAIYLASCRALEYREIQ